jgi:hypothetical protein
MVASLRSMTGIVQAASGERSIHALHALVQPCAESALGWKLGT